VLRRNNGLVAVVDPAAVDPAVVKEALVAVVDLAEAEKIGGNASKNFVVMLVAVLAVEAWVSSFEPCEAKEEEEPSRRG